MKKSKYILSLGLGVLISTMFLTGCGGSNDGKDSKGGKASAKKEKITIGIWSEEQKPTTQALIDAYKKEHKDIDISIQLTPYKGGEYWTKLEASATGGTAPDVFWMNTLHAQDYKEGGILADLTDYIKKSDLDLEKDFPEALVENYTFDDAVYAIPKDFDTSGLFYNKDFFDKANLEYPTDDWTWDDFVSAARKLKEAGLDEGTYALAAPLDFQTDYYPTVYAKGGWILNDDKTETGYNDPKTQEGIQMWIDLIDEELSPSLATMTDTSADAMFEAGKIGMLMGGSYMLVEYQANDAINNKIDVVEFPEVDGVEPNVINGLGYSVFEGSKNKDAAADFAIWLGGAEAMKIQGEKGAVISARNDAQKYFAEANKDLNLAAFTNHADVANPLPVCKSSAELYDLEANELKWAYSGEKTLQEACSSLKEKADEVLDKMNK